MTHKTGVDLVTEAKSRITEISQTAARELLASNPGALILDVREAHEYRLGHLPGALHVPRGTIEGNVEGIVPRDAQVVVYCAGGSRSALATDTLRQMGYEGVVSLQGGFRDWVMSGGEIEE